MTPLASQSRHMAKATPMTPICSQMPKATENSTRQQMVERILTYMVNFTSPAARRPLESAPEKGYTMALNTLWIRMSHSTSSAASAERA